MNRLINIGTSTLLSGGILGHDTLGSYITDSMRRALGMELAALREGQVQYFSKRHNFVKEGCHTDCIANCLRDVALLSPIFEVLGTKGKG